MTKIQGKSILVQVSRRFDLSEVACSEEQINNLYTSLFYIFSEMVNQEMDKRTKRVKAGFITGHTQKLPR